MVHAHPRLTLSACTSDWIISVLQYKSGAKEITTQRHYCSPFIFNFTISFTIGISSLELPNNCSDIHLSNSFRYETVLLWAKIYLLKSSSNLKLKLLAESLFQIAAHTNSRHLLIKLSRIDSSVWLPNYPNNWISWALHPLFLTVSSWIPKIHVILHFLFTTFWTVWSNITASSLMSVTLKVRL